MNDFQQQFLRWLDLVRRDLPVQPLFEAYDRETLRFRFEHRLRQIKLLVTAFGVRVDAFKSEANPIEAWDSLFERECCRFESSKHDDYLVPVVVCTAHEDRSYSPLADSSSILAGHCFSPLRDWIIHDLKPAHWLLFAEKEHGSTCAQLQQESEDEPESAEDGTVYDRLAIYRRRR